MQQLEFTELQFALKVAGTVRMEMILQNEMTRVCILTNVLSIPNLAYNLVSTSRATDSIR